MAYLGNNLQVAFDSYKIIDDISASFNGSTTSFPLRVNGVTPVPAPINLQQCLIILGGVPQKPDSSGVDGFRLTGGNLVFSSAPAAGLKFWGVILAGADYVTAGTAYPNGSVTNPSITFSSNTNTGIYLSSSNVLGFAAGGENVATLSSSSLRLSARLLVGHTAGIDLGTAARLLQVYSTGSSAGFNTARFSADASGSNIALGKSRGTTVGSFTAVADSDTLGQITAYGTDGTAFNQAAQIAVEVDGTYTTGVPGRIMFSTKTADSSLTERFRIDSTGAQSSVIPGGSTLYPSFDCRAWVNFNGTGTVAIRASGNVSSITDNGTGDYTVNFTTAMADANYSLQATCRTSGSNAGFANIERNVALATSSARVISGNISSPYRLDAEEFCVAVFR